MLVLANIISVTNKILSRDSNYRCDHVTKVWQLQHFYEKSHFCKDLTRNTAFFEGWSWLKFNNSALALGTNLKFYTSVAKGLTLNVRMFGGQILRLQKVQGKNWQRKPFCPLPHPEQDVWCMICTNNFFSLRVHVCLERLRKLFQKGRIFLQIVLKVYSEVPD